MHMMEEYPAKDPVKLEIYDCVFAVRLRFIFK